MTATTASITLSTTSGCFGARRFLARGKSAVVGALACAGAFAAATLAVPAHAGTMYRWETDNGTLAFADDVKRIPDRYREKAEAIASQSLDGYHRFTPTDAGAQQIHADRLADRLDGLRALTADEASEAGVVGEVAAPVRRHPVQGIALQDLGEQGQRRRVDTSDEARSRRIAPQQAVEPVLDVNADPDSDAPVVVERMRARSRGSLATRRITVVRQGDRILSVIKPRSYNTSPNWPIEEDLEASR